MSNENITTIHEFDFNLICEFFLNIPRQGPGSPEVTLKALSFIDNLTDQSVIADIGCGTGGQTMVMAQHTPGHISGFDIFPAFIDRFNDNARKLNVQNRVKGIVRSMENLPFKDEELDLIWSEGAIYNIGFERGFTEWRKFLKPGGYIAVTETSWFTEQRPAEIEKYCKPHFPEINTISHKVAQIQKAGYMPVASFILPTTCWTDHYFTPLIKAQEVFLEKYAGNKTAEEFIALQNKDIAMYNTYKDFYGYVFYIAKKVEY
ncbi:class I SAM-dependent methyltransferase [Chryseobacterium sp. CT-SW4]|uniref:class I SAM-dependent methyltransferase n=1 Tax=Chryseobacterium sp. SW-1 TaxID=3157343 RepID=UPI003B0160A3